MQSLALDAHLAPAAFHPQHGLVILYYAAVVLYRRQMPPEQLDLRLEQFKSVKCHKHSPFANCMRICVPICA